MKAKKILFVDDEPMVVTLMQKRLESRGFLVETAQEGATCLQKAKTFQPDLILLDVIMPGMNGHEACTKLKAMPETAHIPVVLFTACQDAKLEEMARKEGAVKVIQKPFVDQLFQVINEVLSLS